MTYKMIYWRTDLSDPKGGKLYANVHLLVGYNQGTITDFQEMANELRKTFPEAKDCEIQCGHVTRSAFCDRFTIIRWGQVLEKKDYDGWRSHDNPQTEYCWS